MSDLSPGCAPKRTSADHSEFMGSNSYCLADSSPLLRRCEVEDERDASGIAETMKVNPPRKRPKACAEDHTWARDISRVSQGDMTIKSWFAESLGLATHANTFVSDLARARSAQRSMTMPLIEVHLIEKVFNPEQKRQIIQKLTDAMVSIEGENMRGVTWVKISEVASGEWGIGGKPLTTKAVKELTAGRRAA
jgi:4-oxalocrotonate tautomerase